MLRRTPLLLSHQLSLSAPSLWTSREMMTNSSWTTTVRTVSDFGSFFWTSLHCAIFLNSSDGTSHLWELFNLELEEGEDVEKIHQAAKGWGQKEKAGGMFMGLCARFEWGGTTEGMVWKEASKKKAGTPSTWFHFQSGVVFLRAVGPGSASFRF